MNHLTARSRRPFAPLLVGALCLACAGAASAQHLKVTTQAGHTSPLMARLIAPDGKTRDVMITFTAQGGPFSYRGTGGGGSDLHLWLDTLRSLKDPDAEGVTATLKNGTERHVGWHGEGDEQTFTVTGADGSTENVDIRKFKTIRFLKPARKDGQGNAMFDEWKYSPFTGEKLRPR